MSDTIALSMFGADLSHGRGATAVRAATFPADAPAPEPHLAALTAALAQSKLVRRHSNPASSRLGKRS